MNEPDTLSTISILRGLKERYENHHHVRIKDDAIIAAVELSNRYITDRFLPDKAIDLMDEAAAKLRMEVDSVPEELDEISRKIKQLEIEREAIKRENDKPKLEQIGKELAELKEQEKSYRAKWQSEKTLVNRIQQNKVEIENLKFEADKAEREGDYGKVAEIRYGKLQALNQEIEDTQKELHAMQGDKAMIKEEVDAEDIADVVSRWTGIPVSKMLQSERINCYIWKMNFTSVSSDKMKPLKLLPMPYAVVVQVCKIRNVRLVRLSSSVPPVWVRRNLPRHSLNSSLMMKA